MHIPADVLARFFSQAMLLKLAMAKSHGLNAVQFLGLLLVGETAVGISIKQLRQRLAVPGSSLTSTLDTLEKKQLIRRVRSRQDRRQWVLSLTAKGRRLHSDVLAKESQAVEPSLSRFSDAEKAAFVRIAEEIGRPSQGSQTAVEASIGKYPTISA